MPSDYRIVDFGKHVEQMKRMDTTARSFRSERVAGLSRRSRSGPVAPKPRRRRNTIADMKAIVVKEFGAQMS